MSQDLALSTRPHLSNPTYRSAKTLPAQIADHVVVSIEEQLYSQALHLLTQCLTSGTGGPRPAGVPAHEILMLITTISVHPSMTTRTSSSDKHTAADESAQYLQLLNSLVGPQLSGLRTVFQFSDLRQSRSARIRPRGLARDQHGEVSALHTVYAGKESLWENAGDVWSLVGWAFNCAINHKHRWTRWRQFLLLLVDVLERDLDVDKPQSSDGTTSGAVGVEDTLLYNYLISNSDGRQQKRRIMRAILADGSDRSVAEFSEVWVDETALPKAKSERPYRRAELDLDNDQYGDYDDSSDESLMPPQEAQATQQVEAVAESSSDFIEDNLLGDMDAIALRQRLLKLLIHFCNTEPQAFLHPEELLDLYAESFRALPTRSFQLLLFPAAPFLPFDVKTSLDEMLIRPLIDSGAPAYHGETLTQQAFEMYYAPFAAHLHNVSDNVKLSLLVEDLMRMLWKSDRLGYSNRLRDVVAKGIESRNEKARFDARKKDQEKSREERANRQELRLSAERMLCILDMIQ